MAKQVKYLEKDTPVAVQQGDNAPKAYRINEQIDVTNPVDSIDPVTSEPALEATVKGIRVWFAANKLRYKFVLEEGDITTPVLSEQLYQIDYDVPSTGASRGFSPVARLYRVAVPKTESVWLCRKGNLPYNLISDMLDLGCKVGYTLLDLSETEKKVAEAIGFLQSRVAEAVNTSNLAMQRAEEKLAAALADKDNPDNTEDYETYVKRAKEVDARLRKLVQNMTEGTSIFGISLDTYNPKSLLVHAAMIRQNAIDRSKAYAAGTVALSQVGSVDANAVVGQANANELPVFVMSDMLREAGKEKEADDLNETFDLA